MLPRHGSIRIELWSTRHSSGQDPGAYEADAEKVYTEAASLFVEKQFFDLKPLVERLKAEHSNAALLSDTSRKPSFTEMEEATASLGKFITVRQDGKGDFRSIQEAIDKAPPNSTVEIQDGGKYFERLVIRQDTPGLVLRGKRGFWPMILTAAP